tara:strand:- start:20720 stop:21406 length:687 start_codon:yes stop_codon:yes gene_type:complete
MTIDHHYDIEQGSDEWHALRNGVLTASEMKLIVTPTLKIAKNDKVRSHVYEIAAQRITGITESTAETWDMMRGSVEEVYAREYYNKYYKKTTECGFITRNMGEYTLGFSPDDLIDDDGFIEIKCRKQKFQIQTIAANEVPKEYMMQIQDGFFVSGRKYCDFIQYSNGMPMFVKPVEPIAEYQDAIAEAVKLFELSVSEITEQYKTNAKGLIETKRHAEFNGDMMEESE